MPIVMDLKYRGEIFPNCLSFVVQMCRTIYCDSPYLLVNEFERSELNSAYSTH